MGIVEHWNGLPTEAEKSPSLQIPKEQQDRVLSDQLYLLCLGRGAPLGHVHFQPQLSVISESCSALLKLCILCSLQLHPLLNLLSTLWLLLPDNIFSSVICSLCFVQSSSGPADGPQLSLLFQAAPWQELPSQPGPIFVTRPCSLLHSHLR